MAGAKFLIPRNFFALAEESTEISEKAGEHFSVFEDLSVRTWRLKKWECEREESSSTN